MENQGQPTLDKETRVEQVRPYPSHGKSTVIRAFIWFVPACIIIAFFAGLGFIAQDSAYSSCSGFFCSPTPSAVEGRFISLGNVALLLGVVYMPLISTFIIVNTGTIKARILKIISLTLLGYVLMIALSALWALMPLSQKFLKG